MKKKALSSQPSALSRKRAGVRALKLLRQAIASVEEMPPIPGSRNAIILAAAKKFLKQAESRKLKAESSPT
jgi:hypothetical protein